MLLIVSVSGGAGSTLAAHKTVEKFGLDDVELVFADTNTEDESLYKLLEKMESNLKPITRLSDNRDIWDCFDDSGIIRTPTGACKASLELKQKPIARWVKENCNPSDVIVSGLDWTEEDRIKRFDKKWYPYGTYHPMAEEENKMALCDMKSELEHYGYPTQDLYEKQYPHNNCGGGCVLAGLAQWAGVRRDFPKRFEYHKKREAEFNKKHNNDFTVLRDQSNNTAKPLSLTEFEIKLKNNSVNLRDFRTGCGCMLGEQTNIFAELNKGRE